jgi:hypothetical protein
MPNDGGPVATPLQLSGYSDALLNGSWGYAWN